MSMIRKNVKVRADNYQGMSKRSVGRFLLPIASMCCMCALAAEGETIELVSAEGVKTIDTAGTYTASGDLSFGALSVAASPVTFDFSANPSRKVVFDGTGAYCFDVAKGSANVIVKGGEWKVAEDLVLSLRCGSGSVENTYVEFDGCIWTNLYRVHVGRNGKNCKLTLNNNSRIHAKQCFLMYEGSNPNCELSVLGGSKMFLAPDGQDHSFYSDNAVGPDNGIVTVAGEGSAIYAPDNDFYVGRASANHSLMVSNKASLVAGNLIVGRNATVTGSRVLVADNATFTAKNISIRNSGNSMTVSNATLNVDATTNTAITVGCAGRSGGTFVLSGASAAIDYAPEGNVEVFADDSGNAEFRIENGATWNVGANQFAAKTSNSVFRITSEGVFSITNVVMQFGPAGNKYGNPASSLSNRLEICDGGNLSFPGVRFSGHGNMLVVSNGCISSTEAIHIGYNRPKSQWVDVTSKDCALVLQGRTGRLEAQDTVLQVSNNSVVRFEIPEDGYETGIVPLKVKGLSFDATSRLEIDCEDFMAKGGGKVTLATVDRNGFEDAEAAFTAFKATLPTGYDLTWENKTLVFRCPRNRFVFSIR